MSSHIRRTIVVLLLTVSAVLTISPASAAPQRQQATPRPRILLVGDSLAWEAQDYFTFFGHLGGADVQARTFGGTAICDYLDDVAEAKQSFRPDLIVAAFSGNALTPCMHDEAGQPLIDQAYADKYRQDVATMMGVAAGTPVLWVIAPTPPRPNWEHAVVAGIYRDAPAVWTDARVVDGGQHISPEGRWSKTLPCLFFEPCVGPIVGGLRHNVVRAGDDSHLCPGVARAVHGVVERCNVYASGSLRYALTMLGASWEILRR